MLSRILPAAGRVDSAVPRIGKLRVGRLLASGGRSRHRIQQSNPLPNSEESDASRESDAAGRTSVGSGSGLRGLGPAAPDSSPSRQRQPGQATTAPDLARTGMWEGRSHRSDHAISTSGAGAQGRWFRRSSTMPFASRGIKPARRHRLDQSQLSMPEWLRTLPPLSAPAPASTMSAAGRKCRDS